MTNKIIDAAREAGIPIRPAFGLDGMAHTCMIVGVNNQWSMERFYAIARNQALEDAAKLAEEWKTDWAHSLDVAEKIRELKDQT